MYWYHQIFIRLRKEYESIAERALTTPNNTEQLMELKEYIQQVQTKDMLVLEDRMIQAKQRIQFLVMISLYH